MKEGLKLSNVLSDKYLKDNGFTLVRYPDGFFYIRHYSAYEHYIQISEDFSECCEMFDGWVNKLSDYDVMSTIERHNKAINQYVK